MTNQYTKSEVSSLSRPEIF